MEEKYERERRASNDCLILAESSGMKDGSTKLIREPRRGKRHIRDDNNKFRCWWVELKICLENLSQDLY